MSGGTALRLFNCLFKENYSLWHHTGGKSLDFTPGMILQPLLGYQLRFYSCAGEPALPLVHGDRLPTDRGIHGEASPLACLWPLLGDQGFKAPRRGCGAGACALISIQEKSAAGGQTATEAGRAPPLSLSLKGTRRASGGVSRRAVRAPGSAARQVPG